MARYFVVTPADRPMLASKGITAKGTKDEQSSVRQSKAQPDILIADLSVETANHLMEEGSALYEDVQFKIFEPFAPSDISAHYWRSKLQPMFADAASNLSAVTQQIKAESAWAVTKGKGVTIAIVDTGIAGSLKEFAPGRRSPLDLDGVYRNNHWVDTYGHGSMCAAIAAGSKIDGGRHDGVAPEATVLSARSDLTATDIFLIYDQLIQAKKSNQISGPLVISNSYGIYQCSSDHVLQADHPYLKNILAAIDAGVVVVFAAGNNHADVKCNYDPTADNPNSIWSINSHDRVISVGTVDRNESNQKPPSPHVNSSRGPGEWSDVHKKPDVVAPTYGEIVWGDDYRVMDWWGTSGACPQVAGLAALLLAAKPTLKPEQVADIVRDTARPLTGSEKCVGRGMIDCGAAITRATAAA